MPDEELRAQYSWAVDLVRRHFSEGLGRICDEDFLRQRYREFERRDDPVYAELLSGMNDQPLAETFVSYWTIAQTLATQSRFWLEDAIAQIIRYQTKNFGRPATEVYSASMLSNQYLARRPTIADIGEEELEHLTDRIPWRVQIQTGVLEVVDRIVGEQERKLVRLRQGRGRDWDHPENENLVAEDRKSLVKIAQSFKGPPVSEVTLQCNLLVVEPNRLDGKDHAWAIRFVNRKTISSHGIRKQERANLLRLFALLVQEKILREPESISVCAAEILPRRSDFENRDRYPDYFSSLTYWSNPQLWKFIGVPFDVVTWAIHDVAQDFRRKLIKGLRALLPKTDEGLQTIQRSLFDT